MAQETLPHAAPPVSMTIHQLPTGSYETPANLALRGGRRGQLLQFASTAVLVQHLSGDVLIDAGFGRDLARHQAMLPRYRRSPHHLIAPVVEQFETAGYDEDHLAGVLITHSHWDHVSGIADLRAPILITEAEIEYATKARADRVFQVVAADHELRSYAFDGGPYLGFASSHDLHGDGSVVIVPAAGHTTGSVIVFVALPTGHRYAFIGDLTWQLEGIEQDIDRPLLMQLLADSDRRRLRADRRRIMAVADRMQIAPAHDGRGFAGIPTMLGA